MNLVNDAYAGWEGVQSTMPRDFLVHVSKSGVAGFEGRHVEDGLSLSAASSKPSLCFLYANLNAFKPSSLIHGEGPARLG